jgi:hypothetical protein
MDEWAGPFAEAFTSGSVMPLRIHCLGILLLSAATVLSDDNAPPPTQEELLAQIQPGPEHEELAKLAGNWTAEMRLPPGSPQPTMSGSATIATVIGGRFLVIDASLAGGGQTQELRHTLGFDRRHGEYTIHAIDNYGTYAVTGRGAERDGQILMYGVDDDPQMTRMGLEKKFAFSLDIGSADEFTIGIHFVDTRTPENKLIHYMDYLFRRAP